MAISVQTQHLRMTAEDYKRRGYRVVMEPALEQLPEFLRGFRPDMLAQRTGENVVVEIVTTSEARKPGYWRELEMALRQVPDWRLDLVMSPPLQEAESLPVPQISDRLEEARQLAEKGHLDAAFLLAWSAMEAAMRHSALRQEVEIPDLRPATTITRLYSDGLLDRNEYDTLMKAMQARNRVAHGFGGERLSKAAFQRVMEIGSRLLNAQ